MLSLEQGKRLITLARNAVSAHFSHKQVKIDKKLAQDFNELAGVFVTLNKAGELRGCIGFPEPVYPLYEAVTKAAVSAAFSDPRFIPLDKDELSHVKFEVSVLTPPRLIEVRNPEDYLSKIKIGRDGLVVKGTFHSGLLLPQVAVEYKWNAKTFLEQTCAKAGLDRNSWTDFEQCRVYSFQGMVFSEVSPNGEVRQLM